MKLAVVENEEKERERLKEYILRYAEESGAFCQVDLYANGVDFLTDGKGYDAVFLDIQMPLMDGMETAERLRKTDEEVQIVFVTNMAQYAIDGYKVSALDFLVKPVGYVDILLEMKKIAKMLRSEDDFLYISGAAFFRKVPYADIRYIEVFRHAVTVHTKTEQLSFRGTLKEVEAKLDKKQFSRPDNCYIVNLRYVREVDGENLILDEGQVLHVSRSRKKTFFTELSHYINKSGK